MNLRQLRPVEPEPQGRPLSAVIRERMVLAKKRFHANDNISDFIEVGELETEVAPEFETGV